MYGNVHECFKRKKFSIQINLGNFVLNTCLTGFLITGCLRVFNMLIGIINYQEKDMVSSIS